jgi:NAD(P)-dependent dehydrogenase (short-subunit alcohol dehydrogenase family)
VWKNSVLEVQNTILIGKAASDGAARRARRCGHRGRERHRTAYTVAKHGILGLSDVLRAELADVGAPVGVSVVMPGMIKTGMNPSGSVSARTVAANVVDAIRHNRSYVFTDNHSAQDVDERLKAILAARGDVLPEHPEAVD